MSKEQTQPTTETTSLVDRINQAFLDTPARVRILKTTNNERTVRFRLEADFWMSARSAAEFGRMHLAEAGIYAKESFNSDLDGWHIRASEWA